MQLTLNFKLFREVSSDVKECQRHHHPLSKNSFSIPKTSILVILLSLLLNNVQFTHGGNCWLSMNRNGLCSALLKTGTTKEECCNGDSAVNSVSVSYSEGELSPSCIFYMHVQGGVPCSRCKETCDGVKCPDKQKCVMRNGAPKCVCSPNCAAFRFQKGKAHHRGPVCGSDGRTYKSTCRLLKRSCRRKVDLSIAYYGTCKLSCSKLNCPAKKRCLLDQNMIPHCVNCTQRKCGGGNHSNHAWSNSIHMNNSTLTDNNEETSFASLDKSICGSDGLTYPSMCDLRQAACLRGKAIPVAYKGPCRKRATCSTVRCSEGQTCLTELSTRRPRCVTCSKPKWCRKTKSSQSLMGPICATNGKTYSNWCEMNRDACSSGIALDTQHFGKCSRKGST